MSDTPAELNSEITKQDSPDTELDELLDSALEDFDKPPPPAPAVAATNSGNDSAANWTEEFIKQATTQFEQNMRSLLNKDSTSGDAAAAQPTNVSLEENLKEFANAAAKSAVDGEGLEDFQKLLAENLKGLSETTSHLQGNSGEDVSQAFQGLNLDDEMNDDELGELMPFMHTMMQSLLSKDMLYPALTEVVAKYPTWLDENKTTLSDEQFDKYQKQCDMMKRVCEDFESEKDTDTDHEKKARFDRVLNMMYKMQDFGHPPKELVGDGNPLPNLGDLGLPKVPGLSADQCILM